MVPSDEPCLLVVVEGFGPASTTWHNPDPGSQLGTGQMDLREGLLRVLREYGTARTQPLKDHPLAKFIRADFPNLLASFLQEWGVLRSYRVKGSAFQGSWAHIPWFSILDTRITDSNQRGIYAVYAFAENGERVVLAIGEGVTEANLVDLRSDRETLQTGFQAPAGFVKGPAQPGHLGASDRAANYEQALVWLRTYSRDAMPNTEQLKADLLSALSYLNEVAESPALATLSWNRGGPEVNRLLPSASWQGRQVTTEDVRAAFNATERADWKDRAGVDPHWVVAVGDREKPVKAVFRRIAAVGDEADFTTQQAAAIFRKLGFVARDTHGLREQTTRQRTWLIAPGFKADQWDAWRSEGIASLGWDSLGDLRLYPTLEAIRDALRRETTDESSRKNDALANYEFCKEMAIGDRLIAKRGRREILGIGRVTGDYEHRPERPDFRSVRSVSWDLVGEWDVPEMLPMKTLTDVTEDEHLIAFVSSLATESSTAAKDSKVIQKTYAHTDFTADTGLPSTMLESLTERLRRKGQIVLQGPPGTGKTFIAGKVAAHMCSATDGLAELVQFHPTYSYEDFIEGIRPKAVNGTLTFDRTPGRFVTFCDEANKRAGPCVLIIDEINRANLAQVFGELMFLLEYRGTTAVLASGREFAIPRNVFLIGTMNTADRSIALVDHALRRRFSFVFVGPQYDVLEAYLQKHDLPSGGLPRVLRRINAEIGDRNYELGTSFFMSRPEGVRRALPAIWRSEIEPYLEEYFFDRLSKVDQFRWAELIRGDLSEWHVAE